MSGNDSDGKGPNFDLLVWKLFSLGLNEMLLAAMRLNRRDVEFLRAYTAACEDIFADGLNTDFPDFIPLEMQEKAVRIVIQKLRETLKDCMTEVGKPHG